MVKTRVPALGVLLVLTFIVPAVARSAVHTVPEDHPTIAAALEAAATGDEVRIRPGVYFESDLVLRAGVQLTGVGETPEDTVIDGGRQGRILSCTGAGAEAAIVNLTLRNGYADGATSFDRSGGALYINRAQVRISHCVFAGNIAPAHGGAIRCIQSSPRILNCRFTGNTALGGGGGALDCSYNASPLIRECSFETNVAAWGGALACRGESHPAVTGCLFDGNRTGGDAPGGAALAFFDSRPEFEICTFFDNRAARGGAVAALPGSPARLDHCTLVRNAAGQGAAVFADGADVRITASIGVFQIGAGLMAVGEAAPVVQCSNFHGNSSGDFVGLAADPVGTNGNISVDPLFCAANPDVVSGFNLDTASPCAVTECGTMGAWTADCSGERGLQTMPELPVVLAISNVAAAPNPFNPATRIRFELQSEQRVRIEVYGIDGRRVSVLADEIFTPGRNEIEWRGADDSGRRASSGLYIVRVQGEAETHTQKITLLK